jgi:hypothetical protein
MSWLSTIKDNLLHTIEGFVPSNEQTVAHQAIMNLGSSMATFAVVMEGLAENVIHEAVATHLGANAAKIEYDFLHALILKANARLAAIALPAPAPINVPPVAPAPVDHSAPV